MTKDSRIPNRSQNYQQIFNEIPVATEILDIFTNGDSIYSKLNPFAYNDEIAELQEQLHKELWRVIEHNLNEKQIKIVKLLASGKTQMETARELGINQSSIVKAISGSQVVTKDGKKGPFAGGIKQKLREVIKTDEKVNLILQRIANIREDEPFDF